MNVHCAKNQLDFNNKPRLNSIKYCYYCNMYTLALISVGYIKRSFVFGVFVRKMFLELLRS